MKTTIEYPFSRIRIRNCPVCRLSGGQIEVSSPVTAGDGERDVKFLRLSCQECGYTMLFDTELARSKPYRDTSTLESFPPPA